MLRSFFLPLSSRLSSLRCGCSPSDGCSSRSSTETVFLKAARSLVHAALPPSARGRLLAPPPPVVFPTDTGDRSGDQKSRSTKPGRGKPETACYCTLYTKHTRTHTPQTHTQYQITGKKISFIISHMILQTFDISE